MRTNDGYTVFQKLFLRGDYSKFMDAFHKLSSPINDNILFLATRVAHHQANWTYLDELLTLLKESSSPENSTRAVLSQLFFEFISGRVNRRQANTIFDFCNRIITENPDSQLVFFAKETKVKVQCALLSQGLIDAREKQSVLNEGFTLCKQFKKNEIPAVEVLFNLLLKQLSQHPVSNLKKALELNENKLQEEFTTNLDKVPFYLNKIKFSLKLKCYKKIYDPNLLPDFVGEILTDLEKIKYEPGRAMVYMIYGNYLMDLECIENIDWFKKAIPLLLKLGRYQDAETSYKNCMNWLKNRGQHVVLKNFLRTVNVSSNSNKLSIQEDLVYLNKAHAFFEESDYLNAMKLLKEKRPLLLNEANIIAFTSLIVNSASKLSLEPDRQTELIDESISSLVPIEYSALIAQLYAFKGTTGSESWKVDYKKTISLYHYLGMFEEEIVQQMNLSFLMILEQKKSKTTVITEQLQDYFNEIEQFVDADIWIRNRSSLKGKLYQMYAHALFEDRQIESAIDFTDLAHNFMMEAGDLRAVAFNGERKSNLLVEMGRSTNDFTFYQKAQKISLNALEFMEGEAMPDFIWRYQFSLARSYSEPLQREIVPKDLVSDSWNVAVKYYYGAIHTYGAIIRKNALQGTFRSLEAIIKLKKEVTQLIFSGLYFFLRGRKYNDCIHWLELVRVKGLLSALAKELKPSEVLKDHPAILKEAQLIRALSKKSSTSQENELRIEINALYEDMMTNTLVRSYAKRKKELIPTYEDFIKAISEEESQLKEEKIFFLYYYVYKSDIYAFGIGSNYRTTQVAKIPLAADKIQKSLKTFRMKMASYQQLNPPPESDFWTQFSSLLAPLQTWTKKGDIICVIPYGFLQNLPFHTLHLDGVPLICRNPVFYNTSLTTWEYLRHRRDSRNVMSKPEVFGDPEGNLKQSVEEAKLVSSLFNVVPKLAEKATKSNFLDALNTASFIHFAGHGVFDATKGFQSGIKLFNGELLSTSEIMECTNITEFIVLASCDTALQKNYAGEELAGLTSAFLGAGAKTVLAGMWPVDDEDAKEYFSIFYLKIKEGLSKVVANQETMITLMKRKSKTNFYHWGMFAITGSWQ